MWDLSYPARAWTHAACSGSLATGLPGKTSFIIINWTFGRTLMQTGDKQDSISWLRCEDGEKG